MIDDEKYIKTQWIWTTNKNNLTQNINNIINNKKTINVCIFFDVNSFPEEATRGILGKNNRNKIY